MFDAFKTAVETANSVVIIQAENPDGDSLGSSLALEEILSDLGKTVTLFCAIDMPKYLHYLRGWDRVTNQWPARAELAIIVDTAADALIEKALALPGVRHALETRPVFVLDHHSSFKSNLTFPHELVLSDTAAATGELIYEIAGTLKWKVNAQAAEHLLISILADTLGLSTPSVTARSFEIAGKLVELGASPSEIETRRREYMRKPADILAYKGQLLERIEYYLDGRLAIVHIPWEDIQMYSDRYNPSILVLDEMRLVEGVDIAVAIKTYPDGKLTGKIRSNMPIADIVAGYFGGGGHSFSAGFKIFETYEAALPQLTEAVEKAIQETPRDSVS